MCKKNPLIQYYAAILSISQLEGNGDAFTRQYDKICRVLTKEQTDYVKNITRETKCDLGLLKTRAGWYKSTLSKNQLNLIPDLEEETSSTKPTTSVTSETLDRNIKELNDHQSSLAHLKSVMTNLVEAQPAMKSYTTQNSIRSCGRQSLSTTSDVNENFTGVHISKAPVTYNNNQKTEVQKKLFAGFDKVDKEDQNGFDVDETVKFGLKKGPHSQERNDCTIIEIGSDQDDVPMTELLNDEQNKPKKKKKKKKTSGVVENNVAVNGSNGDQTGEEKKKSNRNQRRKKARELAAENEKKKDELSERGTLEAGDAPKSVIAFEELKRPKRRIKDIQAAKNQAKPYPFNIPGKFIHCLPTQPDTTNHHLEEKKRRDLALQQEKEKDWSMPDWVVEEERERRKKKAQAKAQTKTKNEKKGEKKRDDDLKHDESADEEPYISKGEVGRIRESSHVKDENTIESEIKVDEIDSDEWIPSSTKKQKEKRKEMSPPPGFERHQQLLQQEHQLVNTTVVNMEEQESVETFSADQWPELISNHQSYTTESSHPESVPMFEEPKIEKLDYLTNNELGLSFLVNDEVELSTDESESPIYSTGGQVELNFTVDLAGGGENVYVENVAIDKYAITDLADIEGDDYVIKFDQQHYNLIQYHINEFDKIAESAIRYVRPVEN